MTWIEPLEGFVGPISVLVATVLGAMWVRRSSKESNSTASWQALFEGHQQWTRDQLAEQDQWTKERLAERDTKIAALEKDVHELQTRFQALDEKYRAALTYIRQLWNLLASVLRHEDIPMAPDEITPDL